MQERQEREARERAAAEERASREREASDEAVRRELTVVKARAEELTRSNAELAAQVAAARATIEETNRDLDLLKDSRDQLVQSHHAQVTSLKAQISDQQRRLERPLAISADTQTDEEQQQNGMDREDAERPGAIGSSGSDDDNAHADGSASVERHQHLRVALAGAIGLEVSDSEDFDFDLIDALNAHLADLHASTEELRRTHQENLDEMQETHELQLSTLQAMFSTLRITMQQAGPQLLSPDELAQAVHDLLAVDAATSDMEAWAKDLLRPMAAWMLSGLHQTDPQQLALHAREEAGRLLEAEAARHAHLQEQLRAFEDAVFAVLQQAQQQQTHRGSGDHDDQDDHDTAPASIMTEEQRVVVDGLRQLVNDTRLRIVDGIRPLI